MKKSELIAAIQKEIPRHEFSTFVDEPPLASKGGKGVVIPGCSTCRKRANTVNAPSRRSAKASHSVHGRGCHLRSKLERH